MDLGCNHLGEKTADELVKILAATSKTIRLITLFEDDIVNRSDKELIFLAKAFSHVDIQIFDEEHNLSYSPKAMLFRQIWLKEVRSVLEPFLLVNPINMVLASLTGVETGQIITLISDKTEVIPLPQASAFPYTFINTMNPIPEKDGAPDAPGISNTCP